MKRMTSKGLVDMAPEEITLHNEALADSAGRQQAEAEAEAVHQAKLTGIEIEGVMCSATSRDQVGLLAVLTVIRETVALGGKPSPTIFEFENGNKLRITADNVAQVYSIWAPFRQSFFVERS